VRTIKEKCCYLSANPIKEEKDHNSAWEEFRLPDGKVIQLGTERFLAPEILFNPELVGQEYPGVHQVIVDSINRVDMDLRKSLFSNIVLSGGSTLTTGFGDRLLSEVKKLALKDVKLKIYAPPERKVREHNSHKLYLVLTISTRPGSEVPSLQVCRPSRRCGSAQTSTRRTRAPSGSTGSERCRA
jgi:actin-related protein